MQFPSVYTKANSTYLRSFATVQKFPLERPSGVTVHYTATGHISSTITELQKKSLGYHMLLDRDGTIYQCADLTKTLWHAGRALWRGASPNREHLALALVSWGWVTELAPGLFESWSGHVVPTRAVVKRWPMWWEAATRAQEEALLSVLEWIVGQGVPAENVCGHNECALPAGRKVDPGGVLSFSMDVLRDRLAGRKPES